MQHVVEQQKEKFFIGLALRTNNAECSLAMPAHKERFFKEDVLAKIPNKLNGDILALYTDYEGDYTKPYSWILGCEVSNLDQVPPGLVGKVIPASKYAVFTTQGAFPQGLISAWHTVWKSNLPRSYTSDFEVYRHNFDPTHNPEVKVYIAINEVSQEIQYSDFLKVDIRVGTIIRVEDFPEARKPAYKLEIDFGEFGKKRSSAQITHHYRKEDLVGKQVIAVVNFPPKQIGKFVSEVLTLGLPDANGEVILLEPTKKVPNSGRLF